MIINETNVASETNRILSIKSFSFLNHNFTRELIADIIIFNPCTVANVDLLHHIKDWSVDVRNDINYRLKQAGLEYTLDTLPESVQPVTPPAEPVEGLPDISSVDFSSPLTVLPLVKWIVASYPKMDTMKADLDFIESVKPVILTLVEKLKGLTILQTLSLLPMVYSAIPAEMLKEVEALWKDGLGKFLSDLESKLTGLDIEEDVAPEEEAVLDVTVKVDPIRVSDLDLITNPVDVKVLFSDVAKLLKKSSLTAEEEDALIDSIEQLASLALSDKEVNIYLNTNRIVGKSKEWKKFHSLYK